MGGVVTVTVVGYGHQIYGPLSSTINCISLSDSCSIKLTNFVFCFLLMFLISFELIKR